MTRIAEQLKGERKRGQQGQAAPEIDQRMEPGFKQRGGYGEESQHGSPQTQGGAQRERCQLLAGVALTKTDVSQEGDQPGQNHAGESGAEHIAEGVPGSEDYDGEREGDAERGMKNRVLRRTLMLRRPRLQGAQPVRAREKIMREAT